MLSCISRLCLLDDEGRVTESAIFFTFMHYLGSYSSPRSEFLRPTCAFVASGASLLQILLFRLSHEGPVWLTLELRAGELYKDSLYDDEEFTTSSFVWAKPQATKDFLASLLLP
jgi:hypothetical protein